MATLREIRRRIRSVKNIRQITKALQAVSASRVRRAQESATATRPYTAKARDLLASVASLAGGETRHPLLTKRDEVKNVTIVLISADRGLAGAFNSNVGRIAFNFGREQTAPVSYVTYGKKGRDFVFRRGGNVIADYSPIPARPVLLDTTPITRQVIEDFLEGKTDEVWLAYTDYVSAAIQKPTLKKLLPLAAEELLEGTKSDGPRPAYDFEPDPQGILDTLLPRLTEMQVYQAVLESLASEHTARMVAMRNATDNASDLILSLTLTYNKARQQAITSELLDIAGGTEALK
ncbi:MAG TPA: ATP synthase F1 subunit gamma [Thermoflexales bacterium]|nr:ATP synthase F1 subunit gamma [Thermoflexales bacterium]HQW35680.1 ATP synthase F1 subunit gamma [Thermoflexales bacterium]HQZ21605.1 ATP synthase F1 subunit gamma [Thermoflexales bacterium]HRA00731.1 ATP synthase F1 subunit gamma [Thermoflexales bacterium]